ncbi:hypothetical protein [Nostoc sp.]|uniref:hypothetical protein n=1 Tax=Nostoc sp. TaxID=1180 RepID=UPI002FF59568
MHRFLCIDHNQGNSEILRITLISSFQGRELGSIPSLRYLCASILACSSSVSKRRSMPIPKPTSGSQTGFTDSD